MFGIKHFVGSSFAIAFVIIALVLLQVALKNKDERTRLLPLQIIAVLLIVMEIGKVFYVINTEGFLPKTRTPFYLCSMFLWVTPLASFSKGKTREWMMAFCFHYGLFCGGSALILSGDILGSAKGWLPLNENVLPIHSYLYHALLLIFGFWILFAGFFKPNLKTTVRSIIMVAIILTITMILNLIFGTNFSHITKSEDNMFHFIMVALGFPLYAITLYLVVFSIPFVFLGSNNIIQFIRHRHAVTQ